jgi:enoyl-[acyl-carrier protein] reductase I
MAEIWPSGGCHVRSGERDFPATPGGRIARLANTGARRTPDQQTRSLFSRIRPVAQQPWDASRAAKRRTDLADRHAGRLVAPETLCHRKRPAVTRHDEELMPDSAGLMAGKRGLIMGVANNRSMAWGIAQSARAHGAELAFTYQGDALKKRVEPLAASVGGMVVGHCDVADPASIDAVFAATAAKWGALDFVVHAIAFSDRTQLDGRYVDTTQDNFVNTMVISCYSFTAIAQRAEKLMPEGGAMLTLTYYGAEKWVPHYNVMGVAKAGLEASVRYLAADLGTRKIRVNAISAGPVKTLAAAGVGDFRYILSWNEHNSPLRRNITIEEVGDTAVYLLSDLSRGVTGEIHHVDAGYHIVGMKHPEAPDITVGRS